MKVSELRRGQLRFGELAVWVVLFVGTVVAFVGLFDEPYVDHIVRAVNVF